MNTVFLFSLFILLAGVVAIYLGHSVGVKVVRRLGRRQPFFTAFVNQGQYVTRWLFWFIWFKVWFAGLGLTAHWAQIVALVLVVGIIVCATLTLMAMVEAVATVVVQSNPLTEKDNLKARRIYTQTRVLARSTHLVLSLLGLAFVLLILPGAKQIGTSLLASAGVAGLVAGMAARPVVGNFIAGLQLAFTQPIRIDDVVIIDGEWGRIEEITATYVVVKVWDERRLIVPLQWFVENVFQNWTHHTAELIGTVFLWLDYRADLVALEAEFKQLCQAQSLWDQRVAVMQITETNEWGMQLRFLVSATDSGQLFDLRCAVRAGLISYLARYQPQTFVRLRTEAEPSFATKASPQSPRPRSDH
ncbi:small-conductance mechanosensitive channel [Paenalcaligenes hominis]|uniref:Small-conductance mechanosensitive channel n=1 Tax=Paenalcaligenes hominis TaxID=643674 RepID=A0ABX0WTV3_9BURK|nr:mechanosensitive ion channel family protein [Paenalcaligenes hominis]NJB66201.1 small-conductance mechanosensitive channel [Paenalcaligenes hominis]GGE73160.1 hypothetical protein GCM10007278_21750 [Paenalcaligenes hominis]